MGFNPFCPDGSSWGEAKACLSCPISWAGRRVSCTHQTISALLGPSRHPSSLNWPPAASGAGRWTLADPSPVTAPRQRWMGDVGTEFISGLVQDKELLQQQRQQLSPHPLCSWANGGGFLLRPWPLPSVWPDTSEASAAAPANPRAYHTCRGGWAEASRDRDQVWWPWLSCPKRSPPLPSPTGTKVTLLCRSTHPS